MAERDQITGFLGCQRAGQDGGLEDRTLGTLEVTTVIQLGEQCARHGDHPARHGLTDRDRFGRDIDHAGLVGCLVEMTELGGLPVHFHDQ